MPDNVGVGGGGAAVTLKLTAPLGPFAVVTVTLRAPRVAPAAIVKFAVSDVEPVTVMPPTAIPVPETLTAVAPVTKFVPVSVTPTTVPSTPEDGAMPVNVGAGIAAALTVKLTVPLAPFDVVTVTLRAPRVAPAAIVKLAVSDVEPVTVMPPTA